MKALSEAQLLDLYFMEARAKVIDLAAFLDRMARAAGSGGRLEQGDFRLQALRGALELLTDSGPEKAKRVLLHFSDPTTEPIAAATTKAACGAWPGRQST